MSLLEQIIVLLLMLLLLGLSVTAAQHVYYRAELHAALGQLQSSLRRVHAFSVAEHRAIWVCPSVTTLQACQTEWSGSWGIFSATPTQLLMTIPHDFHRIEITWQGQPNTNRFQVTPQHRTQALAGRWRLRAPDGQVCELVSSRSGEWRLS